MPDYSDTALMGYARRVLQRDHWTCRYCGLDGRVWPNWLYLTWDHLLPRADARRDEDERGSQQYIVAACSFCNVVHNRTRFPVDVNGRMRTPEEMAEQKHPFVLAKRADYEAFWRREVVPNLEIQA